VFEAAFYSEVIRAGIAGVATGQKEAGEALGLSRMLTFRLIVLPQAIRSMVPAFISQTVVLFQDTSLVYVLTLPDFVGVAGEIGRRDGTLPQMYLIVAAAFFVICFVLSRAAEHLKNR
jgi:glutamate/aspartate transport system permease protein